MRLHFYPQDGSERAAFFFGRKGNVKAELLRRHGREAEASLRVGLGVSSGTRNERINLCPFDGFAVQHDDAPAEGSVERDL